MPRGSKRIISIPLDWNKMSHLEQLSDNLVFSPSKLFIGLALVKIKQSMYGALHNMMLLLYILITNIMQVTPL